MFGYPNPMANMMQNMQNQVMQAAFNPMQMMQMQPMLTPELQQRFMMLDTDHSGSITVDEIYRAYSNMKFPPRSAKMLLNAISDKPYIDIQSFPAFDHYVQCFYQTFMMVGGQTGTILPPQICQAVQMLGFTTDQNALMLLIRKYDNDMNGVQFGEFMAICSYLLICRKIMEKFDQQRRGCLTIDLNGLVNLGLWFV